MLPTLNYLLELASYVFRCFTGTHELHCVILDQDTISGFPSMPTQRKDVRHPLQTFAFVHFAYNEILQFVSQTLKTFLLTCTLWSLEKSIHVYTAAQNRHDLLLDILLRFFTFF